MGNQPSRNLNLIVMHPRAPKIRHLNASHSLLIELEENVKKVQDLESTVIELEKQLQWREMGKKKAAQISLKRDEEEANILRSWHTQKLKSTIDKMTMIPESDTEVKMLPLPQEVNHEAILFSDIETLVDMANFVPEPTTYKEELFKLQGMLNERDTLGKLFTEVQEKEDQALATIKECRNTITSVNTMRIKMNAHITMTKSLLETMTKLENQRKKQNMFVYGPNPIFSSAKEMELNYAINNQFVIEMLKELDMSYHVAQQNLRTARECKRRYRENSAQIMESLEALQHSIDNQSQHLTFMQSFNTKVSNKPIEKVLAKNIHTDATNSTIHNKNEI